MHVALVLGKSLLSSKLNVTCKLARNKYCYTVLCNMWSLFLPNVTNFVTQNLSDIYDSIYLHTNAQNTRITLDDNKVISSSMFGKIFSIELDINSATARGSTYVPTAFTADNNGLEFT